MDLSASKIVGKTAHAHINAFVHELSTTAESSEEQMEALRSRHLARLRGLPHFDTLRARAAINVYADLAKQGWIFTAPKGSVVGSAPIIDGDIDVRLTRRKQFSARRHEQLR